MAADLQELEAILGYKFRNRDLLVRALTHRSFSSETRPSAYQPDNEQLEFFGDAILGFLISECLVQRHPDLQEGQLSLAKSYLVSARWLHQVANHIGLGVYLNLGRSEEIGGGRSKQSLLADAVEAIIAALYLDGGIEPARRFVVEHVHHEPLRIGGSHGGSVNYKGQLWERTAAEGHPKPDYEVIDESGPQHAPVFKVRGRVGKYFCGYGSGSTKKAAEQAAAREILEQMTSTEVAAEVSDQD